MLPKVAGLLWTMLDSARFVVSETAGLTFEAYAQRRQLRSAVERELEIVGGAARRLMREDPATAAALTDVPKVIAFRNVLAHGYDVVDHAIVWEIIHHFLP